MGVPFKQNNRKCDEIETSNKVAISFDNHSVESLNTLQNSSINKNESPSNGKNFVFDLTSTDFTDLASDLNEFNNFY